MMAIAATRVPAIMATLFGRLEERPEEVDTVVVALRYDETVEIVVRGDVEAKALVGEEGEGRARGSDVDVAAGCGRLLRNVGVVLLGLGTSSGQL
jgi:hypothetical protein